MVRKETSGAVVTTVAITGPSGCGKTTLLNIVAGLDRNYEGSVIFAAAEPHLAYVFQTPRLLPWRTVSENVALALPPGAPRVARVQELLVRVGLGEVAAAHPERLSLGMERRALARAFILDPDFLLMDEPFVSPDEAAGQDLRALLRRLYPIPQQGQQMSNSSMTRQIRLERHSPFHWPLTCTRTDLGVVLGLSQGFC